MNIIDIIILVVLLLGVVNGARIGFIVEIAAILGFLLAIAVAKAEYGQVRHFLASFAPHSPWLTVIAYLIVFLVVWGVIIALARVVRKGIRLFLLGPLDHLGGAIIGIFQAALLLELLLYLGKRVPYHQLKVAIAHSKLAPHFLALVPQIDKYFPHIPLK